MCSSPVEALSAGYSNALLGFITTGHLCVKNESLFIEIKTCGYKDFKEQIRRYCSNGQNLEFWCIFKGIETKHDRVKYIYAEELAKRMKVLGREDLTIKCYQFIRNVFDERLERTFLKKIIFPKNI